MATLLVTLQGKGGDGNSFLTAGFALLAELGDQVVVQTVIAGGPDAEETI